MSEESPIVAADNWFVGEDKVFRYLVKDAAEAPINMAGYTLEWVLRASPGGAVLLTKATGGAGITIGNGASTNDAANVTITDQDTLDDPIAAAPATYFYTLKKTNAGDEQVLAYGDAVLRLGATR